MIRNTADSGSAWFCLLVGGLLPCSSSSSTKPSGSAAHASSATRPLRTDEGAAPLTFIAFCTLLPTSTFKFSTKPIADSGFPSLSTRFATSIEEDEESNKGALTVCSRRTTMESTTFSTSSTSSSPQVAANFEIATNSSKRSCNKESTNAGKMAMLQVWRRLSKSKTPSSSTACCKARHRLFPLRWATERILVTHICTRRPANLSTSLGEMLPLADAAQALTEETIRLRVADTIRISISWPSLPGPAEVLPSLLSSSSNRAFARLCRCPSFS
mmetsp:Transcript_10606/g.65413  ORF Transcript_10606/g.65413 Transcript_10606/m.65413 type:complete len:272 (-) Transcript_10606:2682-3497(-)